MERNYEGGKISNNNSRTRRGGRGRVERSGLQGIAPTEDEKIYLVFDLPAVLKHLRVIQKLALHPKFIIVFPKTG